MLLNESGVIFAMFETAARYFAAIEVTRETNAEHNPS